MFLLEKLPREEAKAIDEPMGMSVQLTSSILLIVFLFRISCIAQPNYCC